MVADLLPVKFPVMARYTDRSNYVYLVWWPVIDGDVVKVGYTGSIRERVTRYTSTRGGRLLIWREFGDITDALDAETRMQDRFARLWPGAFTSRAQGFPLLGGGGWLECFSVPDLDAVRRAIAIFSEEVS